MLGEKWVGSIGRRDDQIKRQQIRQLFWWPWSFHNLPVTTREYHFFFFTSASDHLPTSFFLCLTLHLTSSQRPIAEFLSAYWKFPNYLYTLYSLHKNLQLFSKICPPSHIIYLIKHHFFFWLNIHPYSIQFISGIFPEFLLKQWG